MTGGDPPLPPPSRTPYQPWQGRPYRRRGGGPGGGGRNGWVPRRQRSPPPPPPLRQRHSRGAPHQHRHMQHPPPPLHSPLHSGGGYHHHGPPPPLSRNLQGRLRSPPRTPPHRSDMGLHRTEQPPYRGEPGPPHRIEPPDHGMYRGGDHGPRGMLPKSRGDPGPYRSDHGSHRGPSDHSSHVPYRGEPGPLYRADMVSHREDPDNRRGGPDSGPTRGDGGGPYNSWFRQPSKIHKLVRQKKRRLPQHGGPLSRMAAQQLPRPESPILSRVGVPLSSERSAEGGRGEKAPSSSDAGKASNAAVLSSSGKSHYDQYGPPNKLHSQGTLSTAHGNSRRPTTSPLRATSSSPSTVNAQRPLPVRKPRNTSWVGSDDGAKEKAKHEVPRPMQNGVKDSADSEKLKSAVGTRGVASRERERNGAGEMKSLGKVSLPKAVQKCSAPKGDVVAIGARRCSKDDEVDNVQVSRSVALPSRAQPKLPEPRVDAECATGMRDVKRTQTQLKSELRKTGIRQGADAESQELKPKDYVLVSTVGQKGGARSLEGAPVRSSSPSDAKISSAGLNIKGVMLRSKQPVRLRSARAEANGSEPVAKPLPGSKAATPETAGPAVLQQRKENVAASRGPILKHDISVRAPVIGSKQGSSVEVATESAKRENAILTGSGGGATTEAGISESLEAKEPYRSPGSRGNVASNGSEELGKGGTEEHMQLMPAIFPTSTTGKGVGENEPVVKPASGSLPKDGVGEPEAEKSPDVSLPKIYISITDIKETDAAREVAWTDPMTVARNDRETVRSPSVGGGEDAAACFSPQAHSPLQPPSHSSPEPFSRSEIPHSLPMLRSSPVIKPRTHALRSVPQAAKISGADSSQASLPSPIAVPAPALSFLRSSPRTRSRGGPADTKGAGVNQGVQSSPTAATTPKNVEGGSMSAPTRSGTNDLVNKIHEVDEKITALERLIVQKRAEKAKKDGIPMPSSMQEMKEEEKNVHIASGIASEIASRTCRPGASSAKRQRSLNPMHADMRLVLTRNRAKANAATALLRHLCSNRERGLDPTLSIPVDVRSIPPAVLAKVAEKIAEQKCSALERKRALSREYQALRESWLRKLKSARDKRSKEKREAIRERDRFLLLSTKGHSALLTSRTSSGRTSTKVIPSVSANGQMNGLAELDSLLSEIETEGGTPGSKAIWGRTLADIPEQNPLKYPCDCSSVLMEDPIAEHHASRSVGPWLFNERLIFLDKYLMYPKNFRKIASFLQHKSVRQCSSFYYENKLGLGLKQLTKEATTMKRKGTLKAQLVALAKRGLSPGFNDFEQALPFEASVVPVHPSSGAPQMEKVSGVGGAAGIGSNGTVVMSESEDDWRPSSPTVMKPTERILCELDMLDLEGIDREKFSRAIASFGTNWREVSLFMSLQGKTSSHFREFYRRNRGNLVYGGRGRVQMLSAMTPSRSATLPSRLSPRFSPRTSPRGSPKLTSNGSPKLASKGSPKLTSKGSPKLTSKGSPKLTSKGSPKLTSKGLPKVLLKESPKESPKGSLKGSPRRSAKGSPRRSAKDSPRAGAKQELILSSSGIKSPVIKGVEPLSLDDTVAPLQLNSRQDTSPAPANPILGLGDASDPDASRADEQGRHALKGLENDSRKGRPTTTWTAEEGEEFRRLFKVHGRNWKKIAKSMTPKTPTQIKGFWRKIANEVGHGSATESGSGSKGEKKRLRKAPSEDGRIEQEAQLLSNGPRLSPRGKSTDSSDSKKRSVSMAELEQSSLPATKKEKRSNAEEISNDRSIVAEEHRAAVVAKEEANASEDLIASMKDSEGKMDEAPRKSATTMHLSLDKITDKPEAGNFRRMPMLRSLPSPMLRSVPIGKPSQKVANRSSGDLSGKVTFKAAPAVGNSARTNDTSLQDERKKSFESCGVLELLGKRLNDATDEKMEKK